MEDIKLTRTKEYIEICELIFGGIPLDIKWAVNTLVYKQKKEEIDNLKNRRDEDDSC